MNNFIEIKDNRRVLLINLNKMTHISSANAEFSEYMIHCSNGDYYYITKEDYEAIKAKLIDNDSKE